jgi:hypothetical protein
VEGKVGQLCQAVEVVGILLIILFFEQKFSQMTLKHAVAVPLNVAVGQQNLLASALP